MNINFSKVSLESFNTIKTKHYTINYQLEIKEIFKETEDFIIFLDSSYSENHIKNQLSTFKSTNDLLANFEKDGLIVLVNKGNSEITVQRDLSGLATIYYYSNENEFALSSNVHSLGQEFSKKLNKKSVYQLLYFDFLWDGQTIYEDISQLKLGQKLTLNSKLEVIDIKERHQDIKNESNNLSDADNILKLRKEIVKAHKPYLNAKNIVYLSGGIDSVAILIALDDLVEEEDIENHSFKVKGTEQDETVYAESIANHLNTDLKIIKRDYSCGIDESVFKDEILKMNNPYPGMWVFGNQINDKANVTYYAGQDTRLHTPALNILDKLAFDIFLLNKKGFKPISVLLDILISPFRGLLNLILRHNNIHSKVFLGLRRLTYIFRTQSYLNLVYFHLDRDYLQSHNIPLGAFKTVSKDYNLDISEAKDKRTLYNLLVSKKWTEQYVNDIRYMEDMAKKEGGKLAMPFYDMDLAKFSSTIPFELANRMMEGRGQFDDKEVKVNKYVLRQALSDKIDKKTFLRSKAVSRTAHLIFTKGLDKILRKILNEDINSSDSLIKEFELYNFLNRFLNKSKEWKMVDDKYLLKVYYMACLCVYKSKLNSK